MCEYKHGRGKPKLKALKRSNTKIQAQTIAGERGPKRKHKNLENHLDGKPNKQKNAFNVKPCHVRKIGLHNRKMERCEEPHLYPQGTTIHQKGREMLEKSNQNENPKEAQEFKKEGPPLCQKRRVKNEKTKKERKKERTKKRKEKPKERRKEIKKEEIGKEYF
jgi:hypothetical protein